MIYRKLSKFYTRRNTTTAKNQLKTLNCSTDETLVDQRLLNPNYLPQSWESDELLVFI